MHSAFSSSSDFYVGFFFPFSFSFIQCPHSSGSVCLVRLLATASPVTSFPSGIASLKDAVNPLPIFLNMPVYEPTEGTALLGLT